MRNLQKILCLVEPDAASQTALHQAVRLADEHGAQLVLATSFTDTRALWRAWSDDQEPESLSALQQAKQQAVERWAEGLVPQRRFKVQVLDGVRFIAAIRQVQTAAFDLVIKCADDVSWLSRLFGSDDMHLLRKCPCPVLMLKPGTQGVFRSILATVDVNEDFEAGREQEALNQQVLEYSALLAQPGATALHIGSVWGAQSEDFLRYGPFSHLSDAQVDQYTEHARQNCAVKLQALIGEMRVALGEQPLTELRPITHLVKGEASAEIPKMVQTYRADLVVMGTVARTGVAGLIIGNTAEAILEQVNCSVLAIKPAGFKSPVV